MSTLIQDPTRILFFTGKGGVGKTSAACATAINGAGALPPYAGCFQPEGLAAFTALNGTPADGTWTLRVADDANLDVGTLDTWALVLCTTP